MPELAKFLKFSDEVLSARRKGQALVALESTVITHGLPRPENLELARELEEIVRQEGATPATIGVLKGRVLVGMEADELKALAEDKSPMKLSSRDLATVVAASKSGGTTVAATLRVATQAGIQIFATGGIGGVHRGASWDVSADLSELAAQPVLLVCAGAKAILDLPATLERLESLSVPVIGYQTDEFPAFYSRSSGLKLNARVENTQEALDLAQAHWQLGGGGLVLAQPAPKESALSAEQVEDWVNQALVEAEEKSVDGQAVTPFLLKRVSELSGGKSLSANLSLLKNNARLAGQLASQGQPKIKAAGLIPKKA